MSVEKAFRAALLADAALTAYLGGQLFDIALPPGFRTFPAAVYQRITTQPVYAMDQSSAYWGKTGWVRFQVRLFDTDTDRLRETGGPAFKNALKTLNLGLDSGETGARQYPNFVLNEQGGRAGDPTPPVYWQLFDVRCFYREE
jgi:hypothetical protein